MNSDFINECKNRANGNRLGKIIVDGIDIPITNSDNLQSFEIDSGCYADGDVIGSVYTKCLKANFIADQNNLTDKSIQVQIGVKYADLSEEYINIGKYKVERPNNEITANYSQITAYDDLYTNLDTKYVCNVDYSNGDKTVSDIYIDVCNQLGLTPVTTEFINSTIPITANPFTNGEKNRTVLQTISKIACSFVDIDNDTNQIDLCWLSDSEEPDYIFNLNDYSSVEGGQVVYGPINCLIIKNSQIDDENVTIKDEESITENGEHSIVISEDYILHTAELREQAINDIWNRVKGIKYVDCKLTTYYGKPFLKLGNKIRIYINETEYFDTYVLKHNFTYDGTFTSVIESPVLTEQEIKTKQDVSLQEVLYNTQINVDKQGKQIIGLVEETTEQKHQLVQVTQNINEIQNLFQVTGGNNLIKDSQRLLDDNVWEYIERTNDGQFPSETSFVGDSEYPIEYYYTESEFTGGYDASLIGKTIAVSKLGIKSGTMKTTVDNITNLQVGTRYTLNYFISNEENTKATIRLIGTNKIYEEVISEPCELQEKVFEFIADTSNYILEITSVTAYDGWTYVYDLMLNSGDKKSWEPAIGEIIGTTLKLSREGLAIYCTGSDIATLMTAQGFQIRRFQNGNLYEIITEFTVNGIVTNKIECTEINTDGLIHKTIQSGRYKKCITYIRS